VLNEVRQLIRHLSIVRPCMFWQVRERFPVGQDEHIGVRLSGHEMHSLPRDQLHLSLS
jgi:hypothetical protein